MFKRNGGATPSDNQEECGTGGMGRATNGAGREFLGAIGDRSEVGCSDVALRAIDGGLRSSEIAGPWQKPIQRCGA